MIAKRSNLISGIVRSRLDDLGLSHIPAVAVSYLEDLMADELRRVAAARVTPRYVARAILQAVAPASASESDTRGAADRRPLGA
jgi:hypothetical protein